MRHILLLAILSNLAGCTAMMVGGANTGGYEPPADECPDGRGADGRCSAGNLLD